MVSTSGCVPEMYLKGSSNCCWLLREGRAGPRWSPGRALRFSSAPGGGGKWTWRSWRLESVGSEVDSLVLSFLARATASNWWERGVSVVSGH